MKRKDLIKLLEESGCIFIRHGSKHDLYMNPKSNKRQPIPRHREIDEILARHILKILR